VLLTNLKRRNFVPRESKSQLATYALSQSLHLTMKKHGLIATEPAAIRRVKGTPFGDNFTGRINAICMFVPAICIAICP
jgi:hypothetical protein